MSKRAAWLALSICLINIIFASLGLFFGILNSYSSFVEFANSLGPGLILAVSFSIVGALLATHRPDNSLGWIFCAVGLSQALVTFAGEYGAYTLVTNPGSLPGGQIMFWFGQWAWAPGVGLLITYALLLFPDGRLLSPRWRVVAWLSAIAIALIVLPLVISLWLEGPMVLEEELPGLLGAIALAGFPLMLLCGLASVVSLIVRFRRSRGVERQQLKWFTYAGTTTLALLLSTELVAVPATWQVVIMPLVAAIPVSVGIAILRYRLWDIDIIIRRTLVYSTLTFILALIYIGCIVVIRTLVAPLTGGSELAIVASTLAIAALFTPLRRRIQTIIDQRFYRRKYDAAKVLAAFGATVRDETNLDALTNAMLLVVDETVQPEFVGLWQPQIHERGRMPNNEVER
jgi:hypothetical protein